METNICAPVLSPIKAIKTSFCNPSFRGRSRRSEFWWFSLFVIVLSYLNETFFISPKWSALSIFGIVIGLVLVYFELVVSFRRFHDIKLSGWWLIFYAIINMISLHFRQLEFGPILKWISSISNFVIFIAFMFDGKNVRNKYGISPKYSISIEDVEIDNNVLSAITNDKISNNPNNKNI